MSTFPVFSSAYLCEQDFLPSTPIHVYICLYICVYSFISTKQAFNKNVLLLYLLPLSVTYFLNACTNNTEMINSESMLPCWIFHHAFPRGSLYDTHGRWPQKDEEIEVKPDYTVISS